MRWAGQPRYVLRFFHQGDILLGLYIEWNIEHIASSKVLFLCRKEPQSVLRTDSVNDGPAFYVQVLFLIDISCMGISCQTTICTEVAPGLKCFETASARSSDCRMVQTSCIWLARFTGLWLPKRARSGMI